ncbi:MULTISPECIES: uroporphyrinogen-III C-methyltransferase [Ralstonia]|uniref:uroporphyrinogen-III C-methyltransferase n=1 Tax=Ralstonia holmesii TaxID=3058602 RepID=A0ABC8Q4R5_9RALS|nr:MULTISPECIES: uroporphyrinogen-III C-methyltransferase [unclassified Ralstonia]CAJ0683886.1 Uroporphyrinogen-III C-methyltransferase [Ralstonia sp. LMG 32967]CAJ0774171.1 Uroporphyrinogen-III C-methyltransferase [Ralstonia sp. LMG 32967]CAJ0819713.1 Uroporphyrinogen-III C-methyltransferase [Ralstonia sp. LMG 32967]
MNPRGKVYLIGAGPGDVELLTLKAVRRLALADVVLIDDLANPEVLQFAPKTAEVIHVGKRGGGASTPQADIERRMLDEALAGRCVARVKGGDPFVFGRGGEEMQALLAAGIEVEAVNGITAGLAVPSTLGIPLTHRDHVHGAIFVSGHSLQNDEPDWPLLGRSGMTLVIYMGIANLSHISAQLQQAMPPDTPAAAIQHGTRPEQRQVLSTLARLADDVAAAGLGSPALLVIGSTVGLARDVPRLAATQHKETQ